MQRFFTAGLLAFTVLSSTATAARIELTMTGFSSNDGMARIVLMEGIAGYTGEQPVALTDSVPIEAGVAHWGADVPAGTYAIIAHHDRNANDALDRPVFQLPLESYGYSNAAWTSLGLPDFVDVAFDVGDTPAQQHIPMRTNAFVTLVEVTTMTTLALAMLYAFITVRRRAAVHPPQ